MKYKYIALEGNIGSGKTTLANKISNFYGAELILEEFADNPFLEGFYSGEQSTAFPLEVSFLNARFEQLSKIFNERSDSSTIVTDYYFCKSLIFAKNNLSGIEFELYKNIFQKLMAYLPKPDLMIYLECSTPELKRRILQRGRPYEQNITESYLDEISLAYKDFLHSQDDIPCLILDASEKNFAEGNKDFGMLLEILGNCYNPGINPVSF